MSKRPMSAAQAAQMIASTSGARNAASRAHYDSMQRLRRADFNMAGITSPEQRCRHPNEACTVQDIENGMVRVVCTKCSTAGTVTNYELKTGQRLAGTPMWCFRAALQRRR